MSNRPAGQDVCEMRNARREGERKRNLSERRRGGRVFDADLTGGGMTYEWRDTRWRTGGLKVAGEREMMTIKAGSENL